MTSGTAAPHITADIQCATVLRVQLSIIISLILCSFLLRVFTPEQTTTLETKFQNVYSDKLTKASISSVYCKFQSQIN